MKAKIKTQKKKLKASLVLFILTLVFLFATILRYVTPLGELVETSTICVALFSCMPVACFFLSDISLILNLSYRKEVLKAGALSTVLLVLCCIIVIPVAIIIGIILFFGGGLGAVLGSSGPGKTIKITGDNGKEYSLTQKDSFGNEFTDQYGDLWITQDHGETFKCVSVRIKDENGNSFTLTPRYWGSDTYYQDQNGDYWHTSNNGYSYERDN